MSFGLTTASARRPSLAGAVEPVDEVIAGDLLEAVRSRSMDIFELVEVFQQPQSVLSPMLGRLKRAGFIEEVGEDGSTVYRFLTDDLP